MLEAIQPLVRVEIGAMTVRGWSHQDRGIPNQDRVYVRCRGRNVGSPAVQDSRDGACLATWSTECREALFLVVDRATTMPGGPDTGQALRGLSSDLLGKSVAQRQRLLDQCSRSLQADQALAAYASLTLRTSPTGRVYLDVLHEGDVSTFLFDAGDRHARIQREMLYAPDYHPEQTNKLTRGMGLPARDEIPSCSYELQTGQIVLAGSDGFLPTYEWLRTQDLQGAGFQAVMETLREEVRRSPPADDATVILFRTEAVRWSLEGDKGSVGLSLPVERGTCKLKADGQQPPERVPSRDPIPVSEMPTSAEKTAALEEDGVLLFTTGPLGRVGGLWEVVKNLARLEADSDPLMRPVLERILGSSSPEKALEHVRNSEHRDMHPTLTALGAILQAHVGFERTRSWRMHVRGASGTDNIAVHFALWILEDTPQKRFLHLRKAQSILAARHRGQIVVDGFWVRLQVSSPEPDPSRPIAHDPVSGRTEVHP